jgi:hypothetical protein
MTMPIGYTAQTDADAAQLGLFLQQQLTIYDPQLVQTQYAQAWTIDGLNHVTTGDLPISARKLVSTFVDESGKAAIYDGKTLDIPVVEIGADQTGYNALMFVIGCRWNEMELEAARLAAQTPLGGVITDPVGARFAAMKRIMDRNMHETILFGNPARNFQGFFNNSSLVPIPSDANVPLTMTDTQLYTWLSNLILNFRLQQGLQNTQTYMYVDPALMAKLGGYLGGGTTLTVADQLLGTNGRKGVLSDIREILELAPSNLAAKIPSFPANTGRIMLGSFADADTARRRYFPFRRTVIEKIPFSFDYGCIGYAATSEMMYYKPLNVQVINYKLT